MKYPPRLIAAVVFAAIVCGLMAQTDALQNATATYSQPNYPVAGAIDGSPRTSWGIARLDGTTAAETAVFETVQDVSLGAEMILHFRLQCGLSIGANLGRLRLSVTSQERGEFADGLPVGGDVDTTWEVLAPLTFRSLGGATLTVLPGNSILVSGTNPPSDIYEIVARSSLPRITGVRLEAMEDPSLPTDGPGRHANGNFHLGELSLTAGASTVDLLSTIAVSSVDICWEGLPDRSYQVQYSSALTTNLWVDLGPAVAGNGTNCVTDTVRGTEKRFYRVRYAQ